MISSLKLPFMWHFPAMFDYPTVGALDSAVRLFRRAVATPSRQQWQTVLPPRGSGDDRGRQGTTASLKMVKMQKPMWETHHLQVAKS